MVSSYFRLLSLLKLFPLGWSVPMRQTCAINPGGRTHTPVQSRAFGKCFIASAPNKSHWTTHRTGGYKSLSRRNQLVSQKLVSLAGLIWKLFFAWLVWNCFWLTANLNAMRRVMLEIYIRAILSYVAAVIVLVTVPGLVWHK